MEEGPEPQEWVERAAEEHRHNEHAQSEGHAAEAAKPSPRTSAVTAAVLAVLASIGSLFSGHAANQAILAQSKATNQWAYFQSKSTKGHLYEVAGDLMKALAPGSGAQSVGPMPNGTLAKFGAEAQRHEKEKEEIRLHAEKLEEESREELHKHHRYATGVAMLQVGIVLASVSIMVRYKALYYLSLLAGMVGLVFLLMGLAG